MNSKLAVIFILLGINLILLFFIGFKTTGFSISDGRDSSYDFIKEENISADSSGVFFEIENATLIRFTDSGSMTPVLSQYSTGVGFKPLYEEDVHAGDIVSFKQDGNFIVHRVIEKGVDSLGVYFVTKGDNNLVSDGKIRFTDIDSVIVAVIY